MPIVGAATGASAAICPTPRIPISTTAAVSSAISPSSVSGSPISLLQLRAIGVQGGHAPQVELAAIPVFIVDVKAVVHIASLENIEQTIQTISAFQSSPRTGAQLIDEIASTIMTGIS